MSSVMRLLMILVLVVSGLSLTNAYHEEELCKGTKAMETDPQGNPITKDAAEQMMKDKCYKGQRAITEFINSNVDRHAGNCSVEHVSYTTLQLSVCCQGCYDWESCPVSRFNKQHDLEWDAAVLYKTPCPTLFRMVTPTWIYRPEYGMCPVVHIKNYPCGNPPGSFIQTIKMGRCWKEDCPCQACCGQMYRYEELLVCCGCDQPITTWLDWVHCASTYNCTRERVRVPSYCDCSWKIVLTINVTCSNNMVLYVDGKQRLVNNNWMQTSTVSVPGNTKVVAIACEKVNLPGGILASISNGAVTDSSWTCSHSAVAGWMQPGFTGPGFTPASVLGSNGMGPWGPRPNIATSAKWIWTTLSAQAAYCRFEL